MSRTPCFYIEVWDNDNGKWKEVVIKVPHRYGENEGENFIDVDVWPWNGTHNLFSILENRDCSEWEFTGIKSGLPFNVSEYIKNKMEAIEGKWHPTPFYFNLAEAELYLMKFPKIKDFDAMEAAWIAEDCRFEDLEPIYMDNPLLSLVDRVKNILNIWDDWWEEAYLLSEIRVVGWIW